VDVVEVLQGSFSRGPHPRALLNLQLRGAIECNSKLSGTPDLSLSLHNTKIMEAISLHPCVRVKRWKKEGLFSFIPPDGRFLLADFDVQTSISLEKQMPVWIKCHREEKTGSGSTTFQIEVGATYSSVDEIDISFDVEEKSCALESTITGGSQQGGELAVDDVNALRGTIQHDSKSGLIRWSIARLKSSQKPLLLSGTFKGDATPRLSSAITCRFVVPLKSIADLKVTSLELANETGYRPFKGVRNLLKGDLDWRW
jgi:AP-3 complex subunit mu